MPRWRDPTMLCLMMLKGFSQRWISLFYSLTWVLLLLSIESLVILKREEKHEIRYVHMPLFEIT